jgi:DNA-binding transcriptional regulator YdaS (Cro superfamily)
MTAYEFRCQHSKRDTDKVAIKAGIKPAYFNQICHGHRYPSRNTAMKLSAATGGVLTMTDLLFPHPSRENPKRHKAVVSVR